MSSAELQQLVADVLAKADADTKAVIAEVFKIERDKLYQANPYGVKDEVLAAIKDVVK